MLERKLQGLPPTLRQELQEALQKVRKSATEPFKPKGHVEFSIGSRTEGKEEILKCLKNGNKNCLKQK